MHKDQLPCLTETCQALSFYLADMQSCRNVVCETPSRVTNSCSLQTARRDKKTNACACQQHSRHSSIDLFDDSSPVHTAYSRPEDDWHARKSCWATADKTLVMAGRSGPSYDYVMLAEAAERQRMANLYAVVMECSIPRPTKGTGGFLHALLSVSHKLAKLRAVPARRYGQQPKAC